LAEICNARCIEWMVI